MNSYLISDSPLWRLAQCSFTLLLKSRRNHHHSHVRAEALFSMVFVPAQKLSSVVGTLACEQALRGALAGKGRRACYYVSGIRISASKKSMWNTKVITLGMCFSMFVYIRTHFHFALIGGNLTAQSMGSHRGIGGEIQVPEMQLQAVLPFPAPPTECPGELAHRLCEHRLA